MLSHPHTVETNMSPHPLPQNSTLPKMISQVGGWNKKGWFDLYDKTATALLDSTGHPAAQKCPSCSKQTQMCSLTSWPLRSLCSLSLKVCSISTFQKLAHPFRTCTSCTHWVNTTEAVTVCGVWNLGDLGLNPGSGTFSGCSLT